MNWRTDDQKNVTKKRVGALPHAPTGQRANALRPYRRWAVILLVVGSVATLGIFQRRIVVAQQQVDARRTIGRNSIITVTDLRRDARKTQVAILERWLMPRDRWSTQDTTVLKRVAEVLQSARALAKTSTTGSAHQDQKLRLLDAVVAWSEATRSIVESAEGPNSLALLNHQFSAIDSRCKELLDSTSSDAHNDDHESERLEKLNKLSDYSNLVFALALVAGAFIQRARAEAATRVRDAEQARRDQVQISEELEDRVSSRTRALAETNAQLQESMERLCRTQEELQSKEARYRDLFENMQDGVVVYAPIDDGDDFVINEANGACLAIERIDRASIIGRRLTEVFPGVREFGILDCLARVSRSGIAEHVPVRLYQDQRICGWRENFVYRLPTGELVAVYRDVSEQKLAELALHSALETTQKIVDCVPFAVVLVDKDRQIKRTNDTAGELLRSPPSALVGRSWLDFFKRTTDNLPRRIAEEVAAVDANGNAICVLLSEIPVVIEGEEIVIEAFADLSERRHLETQLRHAQKLESVGQLAAGIAHEINTPAQYVRDSIQFLAESFEDTQSLIANYRRALDQLFAEPGHEQLARALKEAEEKTGLAYIEHHAPGAFEAAIDGIARIANIVNAMKEFAHPDAREKSPTDLNRAIRTTLTIARNEYKYLADIHTDFGELPLVPCHAGSINQVILNLVVNAAHAISEVVGDSGNKGTISVRTAHIENRVRVDITDTGAGIPVAIRERIFDPFFTTKEVGKGSGQGLAIARSIIVDKHEGALSFESELGKGSTFTILLPVERAATGQSLDG